MPQGAGWRALGVALALLISAPRVARAQVAPGVSNQLVPPGSPIPRILPPPPPTVALPAPKPKAAPPAALPRVAVPIAAVRVVGVTAYRPGTFGKYLHALTGSDVPLARIDAARQAILKRYREDGYVLTTVNADVGADRVLRFVVIEGHIVDVKLSGNIGPAGTQVLRFLRRLTEVRPLDAASLERYLLLAQDVPGISLHAVLEPTRVPGEVTLIAQVSRQAVSGATVFDNIASNYTGPVEGLGILDLNSFTEFGERTEFTFYHAFPNTENFGQASTEYFIGSSGLKMKIYGGAGPTIPAGLLANEGYFGYTTVFGLGLSYPIIRARLQTLDVVGTFDALDSLIDIGTDGQSTRASYDSLRVARIGFDYARSDLLFGDERPALNSITARLSRGLGILGASNFGSPSAPRVTEDPQFFKFNAQITRTQTLFYPWSGASVALMALVAGQATPNVLPPAEEFYLGGLSITPGYYVGQVSGDNALAATIEVQLNTDVVLPPVFGRHIELAPQFYGFYSWGRTWNNIALDPNRIISSAGGGVRIGVSRYAEWDFYGAERFNRFPNGAGPGISPLAGPAFYWRLLTRF